MHTLAYVRVHRIASHSVSDWRVERMNETDLPPEARALLREIRAAPDLVRALKSTLEADADRVRHALEAQGERAASDRTMAETLVRNRIEAISLLADIWAEYEFALAAAQSDALRRKTRPAPKAAAAIRDKGRELAETRRRAKVAERTLKLYEWHFPWLTELRDPSADEGYLDALERSADEADSGDRADPVSAWLSEEEFAALSSVERNQRALDRYLKSRKSPWELGRDYERYIGYVRESSGAAVAYQGIVEGFDDLGRDLIADWGTDVEVIQCKRWAREKTIHEKHVFQLFGTLVAMRIDNPDRAVRGTFVTTTHLSDRARKFARQLDIRVEEGVPLADYPRIKCNIARQTGERIYHLPFDQQYDSTVIEPGRGECYMATTAKAETFGFRRAWQWRGAALDVQQ